MDGQRFDELARVFATATSRRSMLRALAGSALAGLGLLGRASGVAGQACRGAGRLCMQDANCCSGRCDPAARQCICLPPQENCRGECVDPASYLTNPKHCGECGRVCALPNATAACSGGQCAVGACRNGYRDCNGIAADGCETDVRANPDHCGGCSAACSANHMATRSCAGGICTGQCAAGFADCNGDKRTDGCETTLGTEDNCSSCGDSCDDGNPCTSDACIVGECTHTNVPAACDGGTCQDGVCCLGSLENRFDCDPDNLDLCCQVEPCCPLSSGQCCTDCFMEGSFSGGGLRGVCCTGVGQLCPPGDKEFGLCCYGDETCVVDGVGARCVQSELVCDGGVVCPEPCCVNPTTGARACCTADQYCHQGVCRQASIGRSCFPSPDECPFGNCCVPGQNCCEPGENCCEPGEQCVGVTFEIVGPQEPNGEPQQVFHPGTCCPGERVTSFPPSPPPGGRHDACCDYGSRPDAQPGACCDYPRVLVCGGNCQACSPRSARSRF